MKPKTDTLILGWGNPGRRDDGLGPALIDALKELDLPGVALDSNYQLQVEDAAQISGFRRVVFTDADRGLEKAFRLEALEPSAGKMSFTTHHVAPSSLLALSRELFQSEPEAWVLGIQGYEFDEFGEGLTEEARSNLNEAVEYLVSVLQDDRWQDLTSRSIESRNVQDQEGELCLNKNR